MNQRVADYFKTLDSRIVLGIDGFVDEVWQILASRQNRTSYAVFDRMRDFAKAVYDCGAGGYSNEIIRKRRSYGGFTANTGKAAGRLGGKTTLIGLFGRNTVDPAFAALGDSGRLISVGDPGISQIFEFEDGKLMLPFIADIMDFDWDAVVSSPDWAAIRRAFLSADIIALGYWSLMPAFDEVLEKICENFLGEGGRCRRLFFDFADIRKRDRQSLFATLDKLSALNRRVPISLSLNEHESALLFSYLSESEKLSVPVEPTQAYIAEQLKAARESIGLDELIVHTPRYAAADSTAEGMVIVPQRFCEKTVITAGAGDNFNGGYLTASARAGGLNLDERLWVGNATAEFYVRNGYSPNREELLSK